MILLLLGGVLSATCFFYRPVNTVDNTHSIIHGGVSYRRAMVEQVSQKGVSQAGQSAKRIQAEPDISTYTEGGQVPNRGQEVQKENFIGYLEVTAYHEKGPVASDGSPSGEGKVAVDPLYIHYGTKLYIEGYGEAVAADSGRLIKGLTPGLINSRGEPLANIDVWFTTKAEADNWGRRLVKVWMIKQN